MLFEIRRARAEACAREPAREASQPGLPTPLVTALAIAADQWIKQLVETSLPLQEKVDMLPFLALYRTYNTGVAFSMF